MIGLFFRFLFRHRSRTAPFLKFWRIMNVFLWLIVAAVVVSITYSHTSVVSTAFQLQCSPATKKIISSRRNNGIYRWENHNAARFHNNNLNTLLSMNLIDIDENAMRDFQSMDNWATAFGIQRSSGFQLTTTNQEDDHRGYDVSVMTNEDLQANNPVLFVPSNVILSSNQAMIEFGRIESAERILESLNSPNIGLPHFYLMLKILKEYELGEASPWYPWLNSLPRYYTNGASMTPFCYQCLPPLVAELARKERQNLLYLSNMKYVPFLTDETKNNQELRKWAFQIVFTRSFEVTNNNDGTSDLRIIPMADMFNHGADPEIILQYDNDGHCYGQTTRDVPAGSPLRIRYGDPTNPSYLFARYGFVDESSPASFCKIIIKNFEKNQQLVDMGYAYSKMLFYKDGGEVSQEVWDVLLYQFLGTSNVALQQQFYQAHINNDYETKHAIHQEYYPQTLSKLQHHVETFLNQLEELSANSIGVDIAEHPRLPIILKHNEFVKNTFLAVQGRYFSSTF